MAEIFNYLLPLYIASETFRANLSFFTLHTLRFVSPNLIIILSETIKLIFACIALHTGNEKTTALRKTLTGRGLKDVIPYAIPAFLYVGNTIIYFSVLPLTSPTMLHGCILAKIPATAIVSHLWVKRQDNVYAWSSLAWFGVGLVVFNIPYDTGISNWAAAPSAGALIAFLSAIANIASDGLIYKMPIWESQVWLSLWGVALAMVSYPFVPLVNGRETATAQTSDNAANVFAVVLPSVATAVVGITVAIILEKKENLVKIMGSAGSLLTIAVGQYVLFPESQPPVVTEWSILGGVVIIISTFLYIFYENQLSGDIRRLGSIPYMPFSSTLTDDDELLASTERVSPSQNTFSYYTDAISFGYLQEPSLDSLKFIALETLRILKPSFLPPWSHGTSQAAKIYSTSYLDGVRGYAAFLVFTYHYIHGWFPGSLNGWDGKANSWLIQLPWIRLAISGNSMVTTFYVVSGFSISYKPLKHIHEGNMTRFMETVSSFMFRRHLRLYLPILGVSFFTMLAAYFDYFAPVKSDSKPPTLPTLSGQFSHWLQQLAVFANPFQPVNLYNPLQEAFVYDPNLWTIPIEFRGSIVVFAALVSLAYAQVAARLILMLFLISYCLYTGFWDLFLFLTGVLFAELHLIHEKKRPNEPHSTPGLLQSPQITMANMGMKVFWVANFLAAIWVMSATQTIALDQTFLSWTPVYYVEKGHGGPFWASLGAVYLIFILDNAPFLQMIFTAPFSRYLGKISYSLYMVHGTILRTFGRYIIWRAQNITGRDTQFKLGLGFALGLSAATVATFWAAELATRLVDEKSVRFAKWAYESIYNYRRQS
ncbi:hypothetical protein G7Y89_g14071 [Cudoniella acicularis]|uniref:Acyltransferase 3 domain-containing protein n=1 Tax=Cudoniella acicularis TaxID=354080 RepID=A0A8H4VVG5_9HELO|nr:hypothetical protein G7Y89_g14071 [Cudoniella acicularis]